MKNAIVNLFVVAAFSSAGAALAAGEPVGKAQLPAAQPAPAASAVQPATAAKPASPAPAKEPQPALKNQTPGKQAKAKRPRSTSLDLRHCLELENNAAIAKCAGE